MIRRLSLAEASTLLAAGEIIAVPTDTVYGVAASIAHPEAVARLFSLKERPANVALPMLAASLEQIEATGIEVTPSLRRLAHEFWPGALTIVVTAPAELAQRLGAIEGTVGVRVPDDEGLRRLLEFSAPLAVTSANLHGGHPCESVGQVDAVFEGRGSLAGVIDGGERRARVSTVLDITATPWRILREGAIAAATLMAHGQDGQPH